MLFGVDVSKHQGAIDWAQAKADGIRFAIVRASLGAEVDAEFAGKIAGARKAGLVTGAYHFLWPGVDPARAVDVFLDTVGSTQGKLIVLDVEHRGYGSDSQVYAAVEAWVREFRKRVPAHPLVIYTGGWFWRGRMDSPDGAKFGPLWESHYVGVSDADRSYPWRTLWDKVPSSWWDPNYGRWPRATFLQFTSSGRIDGYPNRIDVNAFDGSLADLQVLTNDLPDTSGVTEDDMRQFVTFSTPRFAAIPAGTWLYDNEELAASDGNIKVDPGRKMPYLGTVSDDAGIVAYIPSSNVPTTVVAYFVRRSDLGGFTVVDQPDAPDTTPFDQSDVDAAVQRQKDADAATVAAAQASAADARADLAESTAEVTTLTALVADLRAEVAANAAAKTTLDRLRSIWGELTGLLG